MQVLYREDRRNSTTLSFTQSGWEHSLESANQSLPRLSLSNREMKSGRVALDLHAPTSISSPNLETLLPLHSTHTTNSTLLTIKSHISAKHNHRKHTYRIYSSTSRNKSLQNA
jgi:hypothetical protein